MRIAVLGSIDSSSQETSKFVNACKQIGAELSKNGHDIIVCSEKEDTADPHIVSGVNSNDSHKTKVEVIRSEEENDSAPFHSNKDEFSNIEFTFSRCSGGWKTTHLKAIINCDLLLTIGGRDSVWVATNSAKMLNKPVVSIPCFDGTSRRSWDKLVDSYRCSGISDCDLGHIRESWSDASCASLLVLVESLYKGSKPQSQTSIFFTNLSQLALSLMLIVSWVALFSIDNLLPGRVSVMTMVVICSVMGVMLRGVTSERYSHSLHGFWTSLSVDSIKGILIGFVLALVHLFSELTINGTVSDLSDNGAFIRISLSISIIAILSGFALDKSLNKVTELAEEKIGGVGK
ncbi:hypothetical protein ACU6RQ_17975 [Zobellella denitrificans]